MSAREILADFVRRRAIPCPTDDDSDAIYFDNGHAREAIEALAAAGFYILSEAELENLRSDHLRVMRGGVQERLAVVRALPTGGER